jgi:hypothetical protein
LIKLAIASSKIAGEWFFICMDSQMVEKVVPESKNFIAVLMGAAKQSDYRSVRLEASELKNIVRRCLRCILRVNSTKIKVLSFQHNNRITFIENIYCRVVFFTFRKKSTEIKTVLL